LRRQAAVAVCSRRLPLRKTRVGCPGVCAAHTGSGLGSTMAAGSDQARRVSPL